MEFLSEDSARLVKELKADLLASKVPEKEVEATDLSVEFNVEFTEDETHEESEDKEDEYKVQIVWQNVFKFAVLHLIWIYAMFHLHRVSLWTNLFSFLCLNLGCLVIARQHMHVKYFLH